MPQPVRGAIQTAVTPYLGGLLAAYWTALCIGTHIPKIPEPLEVGGSDKFLHYGAYAGLAFLLAAWWTGAGRLSLGTATVLLAICLGYGVLDEQAQDFVGRDCDLWDWVADAIGTLTGLALYALVARQLTAPAKPSQTPSVSD
jgi:VanZ family protein